MSLTHILTINTHRHTDRQTDKQTETAQFSYVALYEGNDASPNISGRERRFFK